MKQIHTLFVLLLAMGSHAQQEWFLKMKPSRTQDMGWAQRGGVAFSVGGHIIFGMGYDRNGEVSNYFKKYDPVTNTFSTFANGGNPTLTLSAPCFGEGGVGFSIGDVGYAGLGGSYGQNASNMIYRYTLAADDLWDFAPLEFPGGSRLNAISFVINDKAYIGGGTDANGWDAYSDLWEYTPGTGWAQRANMPATIQGGTAFALNGKGFVIGKNSTILWSYDPNTDAWSTKASYPGGPRAEAAALVMDGKGFVGTGNYTQSFFAYDPVTDLWSAAPSLWASRGRSGAVSVSHGNKAYLIGGEDGWMDRTAEIWELGPTAPLEPGTWAQRPYLPALVREKAVAFSVNDVLYLAGGITGPGTRLLECWAYTPATRTWFERMEMPQTAIAGVEAAAAVGGKGYVLTSAGTDNFLAYDPLTDTWAQRADLPGGARTETVAFALAGQVFVGTGRINDVRQDDLWAYDPQTNTWEQRSSPGMAVHSAAAFVVDDKGCICGGNTSGTSMATSTVRCYDPVADSWSTAAAMLAPNNMQTHMAFGIGNRGYRAGGFFGGQLAQAFHSYDPVTDAWSVEETAGGGWRNRGAATSAAGRGYLTCGKVDELNGISSVRTNDLWEFIPWDYVAGSGVSGRVYFDSDQNCSVGGSDVGAPYTILKVQPSGIYASTDQGGYYSMDLPPGAHTLAHMSTSWIDHCNPSPQAIQVVPGGPAQEVDFPDTLSGPDVGVMISSGIARLGFLHRVVMHARNYTPLESGEVSVQLVMDPNLVYNSSSPLATSIAGNVLTWVLPELLFDTPLNILVTAMVPADILLFGIQLQSTASISSSPSDSYAANNTATTYRTTTASFDPNLKVAHTNSGSSDVWLLGQDEFIDYTIHFQNTGTDTAFTVIITDTLPQHLEPGSIIMGAGSHPFSWKLSGHGILEFTFNNILLPDSNVNETASHGFVGFRILPRLPLSPGDEIVNIANIYFDLNEAVITEPSVLTVEFSTGVRSAPAQLISVFPNPANQHVTLSSDAAIITMRVFAADGRIVMERTPHSDLVDLDTSALTNGIYRIQLTLADGSYRCVPVAVLH